MPGGGGGSQPPAGASGSGTGPTANVYTPMNQAGLDPQLTSLITGMYYPAFSGLPQQTPATQAYPGIQSAAGQIANNPYAGQAQGVANQIGTQGPASNQVFASEGNALAAQGIGLGYYGGQLQNLGFNPLYQDVTNDLTTNQNYLAWLGQQYAGAEQGSAIGQQGANQAAANANTLSNQIPWFTQTAQQAAAPMQGLQQAGQSVWNTAQDPQQALYNRTLGQVQQQQNAANAQAGVAATPYGASVTGDATRNFNIDWQNQQLNRQALGAQALGTADTQASELGSRAAAINTLGGQTAQTALGLNEGATNLAAASAALPAQSYVNALNTVTNAANQQLGAGLQGVQGIDQLINTQGNAVQQAQGLTNTALQNALTQGQAPYNTSIQQANNALSALGSQINAGNQQYVPAQQTINNMESYLGLGQSASALSGQLGNLGFGQNQQNLGNIGTLAGAGSNLLFGNQGLSGALGLGNSGLLGSAGGLGGAIGGAGGLTGIPAESAGLGQFSGDLGFGGGAGTFASAGTGAADAAGGSSILDFLPAVAAS